MALGSTFLIGYPGSLEMTLLGIASSRHKKESTDTNKN
jgi:hypothetical protein